MDTLEKHPQCPDSPSRPQPWSVDAVVALFDLPFADLMFRAQTVHRENHDPNAVQRSTLLSIKTGGCAEDCAYCPQSAQFSTGVKAQKLMGKEEVMVEAAKAKAAGASRCPISPRASVVRYNWRLARPMMR